MTETPDLRQRLREQTNQAIFGHADVEQQTAVRQEESPTSGDLYVLADAAEQYIEWVVLKQSSGGSHWLIVPADTRPMVGSADVAVPESAACGPLTLRCAHGVWLAADRLEPDLHTGFLEPEYVDRAREKWNLLANGAAVGSVLERRVDEDPEYQDWVMDALEPAVKSLSSDTADTAHEEVGETPATTGFLEGFLDPNHRTWRTRIPGSGLVIGRRTDVDLVLRTERVSKRHAELFHRDNRHWIRDLDSTGGTYVNNRRVIGDLPIEDGDVVHLGDSELRYVAPSSTRRVPVLRPELLNKIHEIQFEARFQPLVRLADRSAAGYELFGELEGRQWQTPALFGLDQEAEKLRDKGLSQARRLLRGLPVLVSVHASELLHEQRLLSSLRRLRDRHHDQALVIEIQEAGVPGRTALKELRSRLEELDIGLAFNDFGTDRSRLDELLDARPDYVKFDPGWTRDLHGSTRKRRQMMTDLVSLMTERGTSTIAEGIESEEQSQACREVGFEIAQGGFFGSPTAAGVIAQSAEMAAAVEPHL